MTLADCWRWLYTRRTVVAEHMPIEPVGPARREALMASEGCIILGRKPGSNSHQGFAENNFSVGDMEWHAEYANFFLSRDSWSSSGKKQMIRGEVEAEVCVESERRRLPDWEIEIWDVHDEHLPVVIDWEGWIDAWAYDPNNKMSGVTSMFKACNLRFTMRRGR
ncbi:MULTISPECIES: hypothetical protein [Sphingomonadales]|nr:MULTISPECIES: hypothetical protein [Sphingomonadaceae]WQE08102.1 hypothetical protein U0025_04240 [Sphingobium yanoikuyae]